MLKNLNVMRDKYRYIGHTGYRHKRFALSVAAKAGAFLLATTALVTPASAQTNTWIGAGSTDFYDGANWSAGYAPASGAPNPDDAEINTRTPNAPTITIDNFSSSDIFANSLAIGNGVGSNGLLVLNLNGPNSSMFIGAIGSGSTALAPTLIGTNGGTGQWDVNLPSTVPQANVQAGLYSQLFIGDGAGSQGTLNVLQTGKNRFLTFDSFPVGFSSGGTIVGKDGGTGTVNVTGGWGLGQSNGDPANYFGGLHVGFGSNGNGTVNILSGGKIAFSSQPSFFNSSSLLPTTVVIGEAGGTGVINVTGFNSAAPSTLISGRGLYVGLGAGSIGTLNVQSGGLVTNYDVSYQTGQLSFQAKIGIDGGNGIVHVDGAGSTIQIGGAANSNETASGNLYVGVTGGSGTLTLSNGGSAFLGTLLMSRLPYDPSNDQFNNTIIEQETPNGILYMANDSGSKATLNFGAPAGQASQAPGMLNVGGIVFGAGAGAVVFNHTSNLQFDTPLSGQGEIDVYSGITSIGTDNSSGFSLVQRVFDPGMYIYEDVTQTFTAGFSGNTNLYGGTLVLQNSFAVGSSNVNAHGDATLGYGLNGISVANPIAVDGGVTLSLNTDGGVAAMQTGVISGAGNIDKIGGGTLTLTADNPISGLVTVDSGILALSGGGQVSQAQKVVANATFDISGVANGASIRSLAGGGLVTLGDQTLTLTAAADTFSGSIQGTGGLTLLNGTETLSGTNTYSGQTRVDPGVLRAGAAHAFSPNSDHVIDADGTLDLNGFDQTILSLANSGTVHTGGAPGTVLTVTGNYVGNGGLLILNTMLGDSSSATDRMVVQGDTTGSSFVRIVNVNGLGAQTTGNGIQVIQVNGSSNGTFTLGGRTAAGAYEYALFHGGVGGDSSDGNWYLRSTFEGTIPPQPGPAPGIRVEVPLYMSMPMIATEYGYALLDTLHERVGETFIAPAGPAYEERVVRCADARQNKRCVTRVPVAAANGADQVKWASSGWARLLGNRGIHDGDNFAKRGPGYNYTIGGIQAGLDIFGRQGTDGSIDKAGIYVAYGQISADVKAANNSGKAGSVDMDAYSVGGYWTHRAPQGWYTDAVIQGTWYSADARSVLGEQVKPDGFGILGSLEGGYTFKLNSTWAVEPQAQIVYQNVSFDNTRDSFGYTHFSGGDSLRGRVGVRLSGSWNMADAQQPQRLLTAWVRANIWHEFLGKSTTWFGTQDGPGMLPFQSNLSGTWGEIGAGVTGQVSDNVSLFATGAYNHSLDGRGQQSWNGRLGINVKW